MILLGLKRRLNAEDLSEAEREQLTRQIRELELEMDMD